jgi:AGCS family alanine or glycine:cation symporter
MHVRSLFNILVLSAAAGFSSGWCCSTFGQDAAAPEATQTAPAEDAQQATAEPQGDVAAPAPAEAQPADADSPQKGNLLQRIEKRVDAQAGKVVGFIASIMFYEFVGREEYSEALPESPLKSAELAALVQAVSDGLTVKERSGAKWSVDFVKSHLTEEEATRFDSALEQVISNVTALTDKAGNDINLQEADLAMSFAEGDHTAQETAVLKDALTSAFTVSALRSFSVTAASSDAAEPYVFSATRSGIPIVVAWLVAGAIFFTLRMGFINFRGFVHAIKVTAGKYDNPDDEGEVSHFQALTAALSATVGLGNIAGVAVAVGIGGPGATFWMVMAGLLGMSSKFTECTLGQMYRQVRPDGRIMGGAMYYLSNGLKELGLGPLGALLGGLFAVLCVFASFGGGNAFQVNQSINAVQEAFPTIEFLQGTGGRLLMGVVMAVLVGIVIIGGIKRIAATAEKIVPLMCGVYVLACLYILVINAAAIPDAISLIVSEAFTPAAGYGALVGVLIQGFRRAAFSNEAGVGSAAIAHSAAKTDYPAREGVVALLEPFIDTVVVCTMTALVIVITGAYDLSNPAYRDLILSKNGAAMTTSAMRSQIEWFPYVLSAAVMLFAYSTMISWSYYGERCWSYLFGDRSSMIYKIVFILFVVLGSIMSANNVLDLSDLMILGMAFPNILGAILLSGKVRRSLDDYWAKLKNGEFDQPAG